jgi:predicted permease
LLRLAGGFAIAMLIIGWFDFDPLLRKILIVESSMPTAVNAVVYATEFDCRPRLVALGILVSTLGSALSLPLIIGFAG